jgi:serine/threonine protein kinase
MRIQKSSPAASLQAGATYAGKYEILASLPGEASYPAYKVRDRASGRVLLLRLVMTKPAEAQAVSRELERKLLVERSLLHENVERLLMVGEHEGTVFLLSEYFEARTLADILDESGKLPPADSLRMFRRICAGLAFVHSTGLAFGNLTTRKVLVSTGGAVKLAGVGLESGAANPAEDIRSAGAIFAAMLTGSRRPAGKSLPPVPAAFERLIKRCLDPDGGFRTGKDLFDATRRISTAAEGPQPAATLAELCAEDPADIRQTVPLFQRILDQLLATRSGSAGRVGISPRCVHLRPGGAIEIEAARPGSVQHTVAAEPKYCPPELFRVQEGDEPEKYAAADVYVLGFILYEILLGSRLFRQQFAEFGSNPAPYQWMQWQADPHRELRPLASLVPGFPTELSDLVRSMTEKDPQRRIATLVEVRDRLAAFQSSLPGEPPPPAPVSERRSGGTHRVATIAVAAGAAVCALAAAGWFAVPALRSGLENRTAARAYPAEIETRTGEMVLLSPSKEGGVAPSQPFYIDEHEITNWQYTAFCKAAGRVPRLSPPWDAAYLAKLEYPVRGIPDSEFEAYARWAGKRVPTRVEVSFSAPRFDQTQTPWDPRAEIRDGRQAPAGASARESRLYSAVGFRCAADPQRALELRSDIARWAFWRHWLP